MGRRNETDTNTDTEITIGGNIVGSNIQMGGGEVRIGGRIVDSNIIDGDVVGDMVVPRDRRR